MQFITIRQNTYDEVCTDITIPNKITLKANGIVEVKRNIA